MSRRYVSSIHAHRLLGLRSVERGIVAAVWELEGGHTARSHQGGLSRHVAGGTTVRCAAVCEQRRCTTRGSWADTKLGLWKTVLPDCDGLLERLANDAVGILACRVVRNDLTRRGAVRGCAVAPILARAHV